MSLAAPGALHKDNNTASIGWLLSNQTSTTAGVQIKTGSGVLHCITFNKPVATGVITLYDGTSTGGTLLGTITIPTSPQPVTLFYEGYFATGLFVVIATAAQDLTISYV